MTKTMTAEEVAEDTETVRNGMQDRPKVPARRDFREAALSRLAAQAARVPGLEVELTKERDEVERMDRLYDAVAEALDAAGVAPRLDDKGEEDGTQQAERVAELVGLVTPLRERVATLEEENERLSKHHADRSEERNTAEARVRELESAIRAKADDYRAHHGEDAEGPHPLVDWADRLLRGASQPPPAPAQGVDDDVVTVRGALDLLEHNDVGQRTEGFAALKRLAARLSPTPPPELREAVERHLYLVREVTQAIRPEAPLCASSLKAACDDLQAAYDATGGEHGPDSTCPNCKADHEDAAKYRAAVALLRDLNAHIDFSESWAAGDFGIEDPSGINEVFARALDFLSDTPPSGPGGGEDWPLPPHEHCEMKCLVERPQECAGPEMAGIRDGVRARIAPTPTPEGKTIQGVIEQGGTPPAGDASRPPQSTAPAVWEWPHLGHWRVTADGALWTKSWSQQGWIWVVSPTETEEADVASALARALAEAKREVVEMRKTHEAAQYAAKNESWATAGGDVLAIHSKRLEKDTAETAKKAAESMRERAKDAILKQLAEEENDGLSSDDRGYSSLILRRLADEVGKLPLEAP